MAYASASDVASWCSALINGASNFSTSTLPTLAMVNKWLTAGCAIINTALQARGYTPPADSTCSIYEQLGDINVLYAAARAEMARTNLRLAPKERTRGQVFQEMFENELGKFLEQDLCRAGLPYKNAGYVGGISQADKAAVSSDSDRIQPRFSRGQFRIPATLTPDADNETSAS